MEDGQRLRDLGQQLRIDSVRAAAAAGSGHPTSSRSAADLMAVLIAHHLHYDALLNAIGAISNEELLTFRRFGSRLEGHQTPALPWVDGHRVTRPRPARGCRPRPGRQAARPAALPGLGAVRRARWRRVR
jgi:transketolase N-terminal domain/subunit